MDYSEKKINFALVIELERHIEILLLNNDCVIVPDLGGFMAHHCEARYDADNGLFLPPQRTLGFNPQLKINDSLLAQSYIEVYDISYPEALRRIEAEVNELKQHLATEGVYDLNDIGRLKVNEEGNLVFEPCEAGILTPYLYGLGTFVINKRSDCKSVKKQTEGPVGDINHFNKKENDTADASNEEDTYEDNAIIVKISWIRNSIAIAAALIAFFVMTTPISNSNQEGIYYSQINLPLIKKESNQKSEDKLDKQTVMSVLPQHDSVIVQKEMHNASEEGNKERHSVNQIKTETGFCIVVASQVSQKGADEFVKILQEKGISDARVYINSNKIRRVVCGSFQSEAEAYQQLHVVQKTAGLSESWVYKFK